MKESFSDEAHGMPFGNDADVGNEYDINKELSRYAFPGRMRAFVENMDQTVDTQGMTKREFYAISFACALTSEYVKQPTPAIMEMISTTAIRMADDLEKQLNQ